MNVWGKLHALGRNIPSYPKHAWLKLVEGVAKSSYEKKCKKRDEHVYKTSSLEFINNRRLEKKERLARTANEAKIRHKNATDNRKDHWDKIQGRYSSAETSAEQRADERREFIKACVDIKAEKLAKKATKAKLRESDANFFERRAYVKQVINNPQHRDKFVRAGRVFKEHEAIKRAGERPERQHRRALEKEAKNKELYDNTAERLKELSLVVSEIDDSLYELQTKILPTAEVELNALFMKHMRATVNDDIGSINEEMREGKNRIQQLEERGSVLLERKNAIISEIEATKQDRAKRAAKYSRSQISAAKSTQKVTSHRETLSESAADSNAALHKLTNIGMEKK